MEGGLADKSAGLVNQLLDNGNVIFTPLIGHIVTQHLLGMLVILNGRDDKDTI